MRIHKFINGFKARAKQTDKVVLEIRFGRLTLIELKGDYSSSYLRVVIFNLGYETKFK